MFLHISDITTIEDVQDRFRECFPFLDIAFYAEGHKRYGYTDSRFRYRPQERIGNIRRNHNRGALEIKSWHSVAKVERLLKELYGLNAQIFRLCANGKDVQTTLSDDLTLREQSELAAGRWIPVTEAV